MLEIINALRPDWFSTWLVLAFTLLFGYYNYVTWQFRIFNKLGIKGPRPIPILGNVHDLNKLGVLKYDLVMKKKYGPIVGCFLGKTPTLVIHDLSILKQIMVKNFHLFHNRLDHGFFNSPINKMIFFLREDNWRRVRAVLAPTFSGVKMRKMSPQLSQCCETLCANLLSKAESGVVFDFRELCGAFAIDVVASTAFGIQIDPHGNPKNKFVTEATKFMIKLNGPMLLLMIAPVLYRFFEKFGFSVIEKSTTNFFLSVIERAVEERGKEPVENDETDFLQRIIKAQQENEKNGDCHSVQNGGAATINKGLTNEELLAQGLLFFLVGFETMENTLSLFGYSMALNPEIQERLYREIVEKLGEEEEPTYDSIKDLEYLDMCFSETLRMYPSGTRTNRIASKDITIDGLFIPKDMVIIIPIHAIHNDPEHWEEPEVFNPERFHPSVRSNIEPMRFMPFGFGPRTCVGMRLAVSGLKKAIVKMMRRFKFVACEETKAPLTFIAMTLRNKNGIKIRVEKRN